MNSPSMLGSEFTAQVGLFVGDFCYLDCARERDKAGSIAMGIFGKLEEVANDG